MASPAMDLLIFTVKPATRPLAPSGPLGGKAFRTTILLSPAAGRSGAERQVLDALSAAPFAWVVAVGPAVAVVQQVIANHLSLRLSGAIFVHPTAWLGADGRLGLGLAPLPCPSVVVGDCEPSTGTAEHVLAWGSSWVPRLMRGDLQATPAIRDMVALRHAALREGLPPLP